MIDAMTAVSVLGIVSGFAGFFFAGRAMRPAFRSSDPTVRLMGCTILSLGFLMGFMTIGMVGPLAGFRPSAWALYRAGLMLAMAFCAVSLYRLDRALRGCR